MTENSITATTIRLLNYLRIPITKQSIRDALSDHKSPASLLALSEALDKWEINNAAYNIGIEDFDKLPCPFLVQLTELGGQFGFVTDVTANELVLVKEYERKQRVKLTDFQQRYAGIVLIMEPSVNAGESAYFTKRMQELLLQGRWPLLLLSLFGMLATLLHLAGPAWWWAQLPIVLLGVLKIGGVAITGLLLNQSFGHGSAQLERWCRRSGTDCASILASPGAKLAGGLLSWAELGFFYFAGTGLTLLLLPQVGGVWSLLRGLNILCICFSAYSLYYQYIIARRWCLLCCALLALFYGEGFVMGFLQPAGRLSGFGLMSWPLLGPLVAPVIGWLFFKPYFTASALVPQLSRRLQRFERNKALFSQLLLQQPRFVLPETTITIQLGLPQAAQVLTIVSSPTCGPCARMHQALDNLLELQPDLQVQLLFAVDEQQDEVAAKVANTLLALQQATPDVVPQALHEWYQAPDYPAWSRRYALQSTPATQALLARQQQWCAAQHIELTPTIILNGHQLPDAYELYMLRYLI
ncbi:MAG: vitamin K epoxide reductase family protein [Janthinobacterium lividum]